MNKKLICHINTTFNSRSGSARRTRKVLDACLKNGYEVLLITGSSNDINLRNMQGITCEVIPELVKAISPKDEIKAYKKIRQILQHYKPNIVHTHLAKAGVLGRLATRSMPCSVFHTVHGPTFPKSVSNIKRLVFWSLELYVSRYTNTFIFVGEELKQAFIDAKISKKSNSIVINTARDDSQIHYQPLNDNAREVLRKEITVDKSADTKIISYVARLVPGKQQDHAIQVLSKLHQKGLADTHLVLIGKALLETEIQFEEKLREMVKELDLDKHVHFLGHRDDVLEIMDVSDAVILPSKYEGLPNVVVEAVLSGTPVVSYDVSGVEEIMGDLCHKLVVKQGDINAMAEKVSFVFNAPDEFLVDYAKLKERIRERFSNKVMLGSKLRLYKEVIDS